MKTWLPRIITVAMVATALAILWIEKPWAKRDDPITFQTVAVGKGPIAAQVTANGTLSARSTILVGAQVSGRVIEIHADFNDQVTRGEIIAKLDESVLKSQVEQAQAAYDLAVANMHKSEVAVMDAERQLGRQKGLQDQQLIAGATVESFEVTQQTSVAALSASKAQVAQAAANLKVARTNLGYATIVSPVDGIVLSRAVDVGQTVAASLQAPTLFTIAEDLNVMQIDTAVAEADVGRLGEGMKTTFAVDAFAGKTFDGVVRQVRNAPTTTQGVVTYDAVIDVDNKYRLLRPGMTANVTFVLDQVADAIKIPNAALRFRLSRDQLMALRDHFGGGNDGSGRRGPGGGHRGSAGSDAGPRADGTSGASGPPSGGPKSDNKPVWKLVAGKPKMVFVKTGLTDGSSTQLVEGELQPGDQLITEVTGLPVPTRKIGAF